MLFLFGCLVGLFPAILSGLSLGWIVWNVLVTGFLASLAFAGWESGFLENLMRIQPKNMTQSKALNDVREQLASKQRVIFVGHSLGGAIATLCFTIYRSWFLSRPNEEHKEVRLMTIACPRIGSKEWIEAFEKEHAGHHVHFVHDSDWVPKIPPASGSDGQTWGMLRCGPVGLVLLIIEPLWRWVYEKFWRPEPYSGWPAGSQSVVIMPSPFGWRALLANHRMKAYRESVSRVTKGRRRSATMP